MALIDTYKKQLKMYEESEERILTGGQSIKDEDGRELREGNLRFVQAEKQRLQGLINQMENPRALRRNIKVE